jgi:vacuolar-type H+-ATPase catalytic subunit A/Vma1
MEDVKKINRNIIMKLLQLRKIVPTSLKSGVSSSVRITTPLAAPRSATHLLQYAFSSCPLSGPATNTGTTHRARLQISKPASLAVARTISTEKIQSLEAFRNKNETNTGTKQNKFIHQMQVLKAYFLPMWPKTNVR